VGGGAGRSYNESKSVPVPVPVPAPVDKSLFASTTSLNDQDDFIEEVYDNLAKQNISVEMIHSESAPGQLEVVLPYETDVMKLADNVVLAKETIQVCAQKHNMDALFDPKIWDDKAGNGMHLHLSLRDEMSDDPSRNIFPNDHNNSAGSPSSSGMSSVAESFLEGILSHLKSLVSLTLPTVDSYDRIGPGCWTGHRVEWSIEDKESPLRVCIDANSKKNTNVELKLVDNTCNIYLALAAILWVGSKGIASELKFRPEKRSKPYDCIEDNLLPSTLEEALLYLEQDIDLIELMGQRLCKSYIAVKRAEIAHQQII